MSHPPAGRVVRWVALVALCAACAGPTVNAPDATRVPAWTSRATPEARGEFQVLPDGKRLAVRYRGWSTRDFNFRTYAYDDRRPEPAVQTVTMPAGVTGNPRLGYVVFLSRAKGPCTGCHLIPVDELGPAGSVGPDQSTIGDRKLTDQYLYQVIWDPRVFFPTTSMPPWGTAGVLSSEEVVHLVAYLQTLKGPVAPEKDPDRNPFTRRRPTGFGDNLDATNNPGVMAGEEAEALWRARGSTGKACADCHGDIDVTMKGVATRYPRFVKAYARVMSVEDFLAVHGPARTGRELPMESDDNVHLAVRLKMASNGHRVALDLESPEARAALARGEATFGKRVGQRNHACADCHTPEKGANKFRGGRWLADVTEGMTRHFPTFRTDRNQLWDMRK